MAWGLTPHKIHSLVGCSSEAGKFYEATKETAEAVGFYDNMRKLIPAIRHISKSLSCRITAGERATTRGGSI